MTVRVGVDVGGTFTKAVAFDLIAGKVIARASVPTTHEHPDGPSAGVVTVIADVANQVGADSVELVTYSTTQAVNALLEGDVGVVGVIGLGAAPNVRKARKRTRLDDVDVSKERRLPTVAEFIDVTDGLADAAVGQALMRFRDAGVSAVCAAETFATETSVHEQRVLDLAAESGFPGCAASDMSGLYGLELRAVTAALNASILPVAVRTADFVQTGVAAAGIRAPLMVMRGDGGATDLEGFRRAPARTLYSGPAASVAGVLRFVRVDDGVVVEVGGTSTNVAVIRGGRPSLSYVQVASHATALRALDVRVVGVAGGSMLRARRGQLYGVGPRSAHIAGLPYACYLTTRDLVGATPELIAPRDGDPAEYVALRLRDGRRAALTNTCAAVSLGVVHEGDYACGDTEAAQAAFTLAGPLLRLPGDEVARRMLEASGGAVAELVRAAIADHQLRDATIVAVGGGAGGLGRWTASMLGLDCRVPDGAEAISSIGDALSLVRAERERHVTVPTADDSAALAALAEEDCLASGAAADSLDVRVEFDSDRSTLRAVALGAVGLASGVVPGRSPIDREQASTIAREHGFAAVDDVGRYWLAIGDAEVLVLDRYGDVVVHGNGGALVLQPAADDGAQLSLLLERETRRLGPVAVAPTVHVIEGPRLLTVTPDELVSALSTRHDAQAVVVTRG